MRPRICIDSINFVHFTIKKQAFIDIEMNIAFSPQDLEPSSKKPGSVLGPGR